MRALVAFGTRYGTTAQVAQAIASVVRDHGNEVVVADLRKGRVKDIEGYDLVVVGSSITYGSWSRDALDFLEDHGKELSERDLALFVCCGDIMRDPGRTDEHREKYLFAIAASHGLEPRTMGLFGGVLDFSKYGFLVNGLLAVRSTGRKDLEAKGLDLDRPYDFRDWDQIRAWARSLIKDPKGM